METLIQRGMWLCRFDDAFKLGHYPISEVDGRSHGDLVGGERAGWAFVPPSSGRCSGWRLETLPSLARSF